MGARVGDPVGVNDGSDEGDPVGVKDGSIVGVEDGSIVGVNDGSDEGDPVGARLGMLSVCSTDEFSSSLLSDDDADHKATVGPKLLSYPFLEHRSQPPFWTLELVLYSGHSGHAFSLEILEPRNLGAEL